MRGAIHGIWFTGPGGKLHPAIIPKLAAWVPIAAEEDFYVVLWTNLQELDPQEITRLNDAKIIVADHTACKDSSLYKYFHYFLQKGINGDKAAFALSSDILRMAILDSTANDKYYIYLDPNDVKLLDLRANLQNLEVHMQQNALGFAFPVGPVSAEVFDIRNDVLVALKSKNPNFFKDYLNAYWVHVDKNYKKYATPTTDAQAKVFANTITNDTATPFFRLEKPTYGSVRVVTQFANYSAAYEQVNSNSFLNYTRVFADGNTWLPDGAAYTVAEEVTFSAMSLDNIVPANKQVKVAAAAAIFMVLLLAAIVILRRHNIKRSSKRVLQSK